MRRNLNILSFTILLVLFYYQKYKNNITKKIFIKKFKNNFDHLQ